MYASSTYATSSLNADWRLTTAGVKLPFDTQDYTKVTNSENAVPYVCFSYQDGSLTVAYDCVFNPNRITITNEYRLDGNVLRIFAGGPTKDIILSKEEEATRCNIKNVINDFSKGDYLVELYNIDGNVISFPIEVNDNLNFTLQLYAPSARCFVDEDLEWVYAYPSKCSSVEDLVFGRVNGEIVDPISGMKYMQYFQFKGRDSSLDNFVPAALIRADHNTLYAKPICSTLSGDYWSLDGEDLNPFEILNGEECPIYRFNIKIGQTIFVKDIVRGAFEPMTVSKIKYLSNNPTIEFDNGVVWMSGVGSIGVGANPLVWTSTSASLNEDNALKLMVLRRISSNEIIYQNEELLSTFINESGIDELGSISRYIVRNGDTVVVNSEAASNVSIISSDGTIVKSISGIGNYSIDISMLPSGFYIISLKEQGQIRSIKIFK